MKNLKIIIVGATGRVGREMLKILSEREFPSQNLYAAASKKSAGSFLKYGCNSRIEVQDLELVDFSKYDISLFSAGSEVSKQFAPIAASKNCLVIDNTSYFRMNLKVPLIVPEINFDSLKRYDSKIIANPNCSTIQMVLPLKPLHDMFGLSELVVSTYQAVSGAGQKGVEELTLQIKQINDNHEITPTHFKKQIAYNVIPQIDSFSDFGYTKEELKMINETKKILDLSEDVAITATCVRVPVFVGHAVSVFAKFKKNVDIDEARRSLENFDGIKVIDNSQSYEYITPLEAASKDYVFVSRLRPHPTLKNALSFWCVSDNLRKGAALNAIQIAEKL